MDVHPGKMDTEVVAYHVTQPQDITKLEKLQEEDFTFSLAGCSGLCHYNQYTTFVAEIFRLCLEGGFNPELSCANALMAFAERKLKFVSFDPIANTLSWQRRRRYLHPKDYNGMSRVEEKTEVITINVFDPPQVIFDFLRKKKIITSFKEVTKEYFDMFK